MSLCTDADFKSIFSNSQKLQLKDSFLQDLFNSMAKILLECIKKRDHPQISLMGFTIPIYTPFMTET